LRLLKWRPLLERLTLRLEPSKLRLRLRTLKALLRCSTRIASELWLQGLTAEPRRLGCERSGLLLWLLKAIEGLLRLSKLGRSGTCTVAATQKGIRRRIHDYYNATKKSAVQSKTGKRGQIREVTVLRNYGRLRLLETQSNLVVTWNQEISRQAWGHGIVIKHESEWPRHV